MDTRTDRGNIGIGTSRSTIKDGMGNRNSRVPHDPGIAPGDPSGGIGVILDVADRMRVQGYGAADPYDTAGIWLAEWITPPTGVCQLCPMEPSDTTTTCCSLGRGPCTVLGTTCGGSDPILDNKAFIGMKDANNVGFFGAKGADWAFWMNIITGDVSFAAPVCVLCAGDLPFAHACGHGYPNVAGQFHDAASTPTAYGEQCEGAEQGIQGLSTHYATSVVTLCCR